MGFFSWRGKGNSKPVAAKSPMSAHESAASEFNAILLSLNDTAAPMADVSTVHLALGALAGFGIQMGLRRAVVETGRIAAAKAFMVVEDTTGRKYYFGDLINGGLFGGAHGQQISVYSLLAGGASAAGAKVLPDVNEVAKHVASTVGHEEFGVARAPAPYQPRQTARDAVKAHWPAAMETLTKFSVEPLFWGWTFATGAHHLIIERKANFDPAIAAGIGMDAAAAASKLDPEEIGARN